MAVILTTWEAEIGGSRDEGFEASLGKRFKRPHL
jgi:hypothetical protein